MKMLDLGKKEPDYGSPVSAPEPDPKQKTVVRYPSLYLSNRKLEMPDTGTTGTATIKYKILSKSETERQDRDGKKEESCDCEIEIIGISFDSQDKASGAKSPAKSADDEIEEGLAKAEKKTSDSKKPKTKED